MADGTTNGAGANGETGEFKTFSGTGFGTMMIRFSAGPKDTPKVASSRAYLRGGLPAVYQEGDFGMRFIGALETLLDPIVAVLDALPAHFSPGHAPRDGAAGGRDRAPARHARRDGACAVARVPEAAAARRRSRRGADDSARRG